MGTELIEPETVADLLAKARDIAVRDYRLTGKPLGITGEIGEYLAAKHLDLKLSEARSPGFDAVDKMGKKIQIKARSIPAHKKLTGQRVGAIKLDHEWTDVILVLMNEFFEPISMYRAGRAEIAKALQKPGSRARNDRGALAIVQFTKIGQKVWPSGELGS